MKDLWQPVAKHLLFPLHSRWEDNGVPAHLRELEATQFLPPHEVQELQFRRLRALLQHANDNCPFYRSRFAACGFNPLRLHDLDDLAIVPPLTKEDIRLHALDMRARNLPADRILDDKTGGSTGQPLHFFLDRARFFSRIAAAHRHDRWTGWDIGHKAAYLWGARRDIARKDSLAYRLRTGLLERTLVLDTSNISVKDLAGFRARLLRFRPVIYVAYANSIHLYAKYLVDAGIRSYHRPRAIITSAEFLDPERRQFIEKVFECRVFDRYGSRETGIIASECDRHAGLHHCAEALLLEVARQGLRVQPGEQGRILVTDLLNVGMPFIRYDIGDVGEPTQQACACGRGLPLLKMTGGRVTDFLVTTEGRVISGASLTIYLIANAPGVAQAQLVQQRSDEIIVKIVPAPDFGERTRDFFAREMPRFFGSKVRYELVCVEQIPAEASGKRRFSISSVDPADIF